MASIRVALGSGASYYMSAARQANAYYCGTPGIFLGSGAKALGLLEQKVTEKAFVNLWNGKSLDGKSDLVQIQKNRTRPRVEHVPAVDMTLSLDKSTSLLI